MATAFPGLSLLCSGFVPPTPNESIGSTKMRDTLEAVRKVYDYIVIVCTPMMILSDALPLSAIAHGCILVVNAKYSETGGATDMLSADSRCSKILA